ncbi:PKD domain-containing protein [Peredibacter sp. HCB2-198]|uniref:PKD domain-containing protein n=1 Tax=Peredibacter sp. HCB2-198 TaxID=3383025 RepID=UPI0038B4ECB3
MTNRKLIVPALLLTLSFSEANAKPGLKPVTKNELKYMQKELGIRRIKRVKPNALGLKRINAERAKKGLSTLPASAMKYGKETEVDSVSDVDSELVGAISSEVSSEDFGGSMPAAIDNSLLPSFPTIGNQILGSCAAWAMGYYQHSHNNGLVMGWANNTTTDNSHKCSTKFVYNMINDGVDDGAYFADALAMLQKHGCVPWSVWPEDSNYREWNTNLDHLKIALSRRNNAAQYITNVDTAAGLEQVKQLLANGYVLTYGTYITSWTYTTIKADPAQASNPLAGQQVMRYMNGTVDGHGMTIVGYDDNAWVDINNNNVVDTGEKGVLKIANSFGTSWKNKGYVFLAYDALKAVSAVPGGPSSGRVAAFMSNRVYHQVPRSANGVAYQPKYLAKFTMNHARRNQLAVKFGWSTTANTSATSTFTPFTLYNKGGAYAFNGTTTAVTSTFLMDISDLPFNGSDNKVYFTMTDSSTGYPATLSSFEVMDVVNSTQSAASIPTPLTADGGSKTISMNYVPTNANMAPVASISSSVSSGYAPLAVNFDGGASTDPDGTIASYTWNFGDGTTASGAYVTKTYNNSGNYTATLTVKDNDGATSSATKTINVSAVSTVDTTKPVVTLTSPANGARYSRYATVPAAATASDNKAVTKVIFYVNGFKKCTDTTAPYTCNFSMPRGTSVSVKARAYDAANNYADSSTNYISN